MSLLICESPSLFFILTRFSSNFVVPQMSLGKLKEHKHTNKSPDFFP